MSTFQSVSSTQHTISDCNLSNQTAISAIRLQSPQSMIRFYHVVPLGVHIPECVKHPAHRFRLQSQQSDCNLSNKTAISAIRLQFQQSDCNLSNQTAISTIRLQSPQSDCNLILQSVDCIWITQRERFNPWEMFWKYWHMAFIRLLGLLGFDCFRITWRLHQIALDYWDCT